MSSLRRCLAIALVLGCLVNMALAAREEIERINQDEPIATAFDEDAWYSFNVARNVASGDGVTVDGTHATTGFQPLWTFGLAVPFVLHDNVKVALAGVASISFALWLLGAFLFSGIVVHLYRPKWLRHHEVFLLAAFVFLADRWLRNMFFNGLETGLCIVLLLLVSRFLLAPQPSPSTRTDLYFGLLLGLVLLARIDGLLIVAAAVTLRVLLHRPAQTLRSIVVPSAVALGCLSPWLVFSFATTGSPLPQTARATGAQLAPYVPSSTVRVRLESAVDRIVEMSYWPYVPGRLETSRTGVYVVAALIAVVALALLRPALRRWSARQRWVSGVIAGSVVLFVATYVLNNRSYWFYARYFTPIRVIVLALLTLAVVRAIELVGPRMEIVTVAGLTALVIASTTAVVRPEFPDVVSVYTLGPEIITLRRTDAFDGCGLIGMAESGRTGYAFPTRIVNLDGKVNVDALEAIADGRHVDYLDESGIRVVYLRYLGFSLDEIDAQLGGRFDLHTDPHNPAAVIGVRKGFDCASASGQP